jgi:hypothetical protein
VIDLRFSIKLYDRLDLELFELGWFPARVSRVHQAQIDTLAAVEVRIEGPMDDDAAFDESDSVLRGTTRTLLERASSRQLLLAVDYKPMPASRVRSYKGLLAKRGRLPAGTIVEREIPLERTLTYFVSVAEIVDESWPDAWEVAGDQSQACLLCDRSNELGRADQIITRVPECLSIHNVINLDYMALITEFSQHGAVVGAVSGDRNDDYLQLKIFATRDISHRIFSMASELEGRRIR